MQKEKEIEEIRQKEAELSSLIGESLEQKVIEARDRYYELLEEYLRLNGYKMPKANKIDVKDLISKAPEMMNNINQINDLLKLFGKNFY